jgi:hypothetical protein
VIRLLIALVLLTVVLNECWPMSAREQAAASAAHAICARRPQPDVCRPNGHPSDLIKPAVGIGTPEPAPRKETTR